MRVLLDTSWTRRPSSGTGVYLRMLVPALRAAGVDVVEACDERRPPPAGGGVGSARNLAHDLAWRQRLARRAREVGADVIHHPLPARSWRAPCPQVVTVHDLAFLQAPTLFARGWRAWARFEHRAAARRADATVCVSEATRRELIGRWRVSPERAVVALHGPGQYEGVAVRRHAQPRWFLYVGDAEPRKNLRLLLAAHRRYRDEAGSSALELVLAGAVTQTGADRWTAPPYSFGGATGGVRIEAQPDAERLRELHAGAAALVHPAVLEGFGLTVLEAMQLGTPVIAVRNAAISEVGGDAALYVPVSATAAAPTSRSRAGASPASVDETAARALAAHMGRLAADPMLRERLSDAGRRRARQFSWAEAARAHVRAYTLALSLSERAGPRQST